MVKQRRAFEVFAALLLGAFAWLVFSSQTEVLPTPTSPPTSSDVAQKASESKSDARTPQRRRDAGEKSSEPEAPPPADDPSKWPIRVTTNVPGASVTMQVVLYGGEPDPAPETKTTDANGFVGFAAPADDVPVHKFEFTARADGFAPARAALGEPGEAKMTLKPGVAVRGFVRDPAGGAVAGADVLVASLHVTVLTPKASADARGAFEVWVEEAGRMELAASHRDFLPRHFGDDEIEAPASDVVVVLERGLQVSGRVSFPNGLPVPGVKVLIVDEDSTKHVATDASGRYAASGLARGRVSVRCEVDGQTRGVDAGATDVDFVVLHSVARVRYLDDKGRPFRFAGTSVRVVKGGEVLAMSAGQGPSDGLDIMDGPPGAEVLVSASSPDGRVGSGKATFDDTPRLHDIDVVLGATKPTGTIRLVVRWESAETPKTVYVTVDDAVGSTVAGDSRKAFALNAAAAGEIPNVPAGRVKVTVAAAAHWSAPALDTMLVTSVSSADVEVGRTTEVVATLSVGGRIRATVKDENGVAVAPDIVRLKSASGDGVNEMFVRRNADGGWTSELDATPSVMIDALPPGRYVLLATMSDGRDARKEVDVEKGRTVDVELVVTAGR